MNSINLRRSVIAAVIRPPARAPVAHFSKTLFRGFGRPALPAPCLNTDILRDTHQPGTKIPRTKSVEVPKSVQVLKCPQERLLNWRSCRHEPQETVESCQRARSFLGGLNPEDHGLWRTCTAATKWRRPNGRSCAAYIPRNRWRHYTPAIKSKFWNSDSANRKYALDAAGWRRLGFAHWL
jgi:hypothetical protein